MKKYLNISMGYAIAALVGGVFFREFTKVYKFTGVTALGKVHGHLFGLGTMMFLLIALFAANRNLEGLKSFRVFVRLYHVGLPLTAVMMFARGITEVLALPLTRMVDASISGIAGIGHILVTVALMFLFASLKKVADQEEVQAA